MSFRFRAHYFQSKIKSCTFESPEDHSYHFKVFIGKHKIQVEKGDSIYIISDDEKNARVSKGPCAVQSLHCATVIRGFTPPSQSVSLKGLTSLPYINGCSSKQVIPPPRPGDPTLQFLYMPPFSSEQAHHIHPTARVAYILRGKGKSIVGMEGESFSQELNHGLVCILEPMCPHHFETPFSEDLVVLPLHVFSTASSVENQHPMLSGTFLVK